MIKEKVYCNSCKSYWCDGRKIGCTKGHSPTPILDGYTNCKDFDNYYKDKEPYIYEDSTSLGYVDRTNTVHNIWNSSWVLDGNKVICIELTEHYNIKFNASKFVLNSKDEIWNTPFYKEFDSNQGKNPKRYSFRAYKMAYNRHKEQAERHFGIFVEKKKKPPKTKKIIYLEYQYGGGKKYGIANYELGKKTINGTKPCYVTEWSEEKQKLMDEYRAKVDEWGKYVEEFNDKLFKKEDGNKGKLNDL